MIKKGERKYRRNERRTFLSLYTPPLLSSGYKNIFQWISFYHTTFNTRDRNLCKVPDFHTLKTVMPSWLISSLKHILYWQRLLELIEGDLDKNKCQLWCRYTCSHEIKCRDYTRTACSLFYNTKKYSKTRPLYDLKICMSQSGFKTISHMTPFAHKYSTHK